MPLSVSVRDYLGEQLATSCDVDFDQFCERATVLGQSFLGTVDRYDETVFNRRQISVVRKEIGFVLAAAGAETAQAAGEKLLEFCDLVEAKPHRYLIFVGD